ncbi:larval cuticle protein 65Ag1-like [Chironomus tepperi]|uniref:larval cuticle protein 65Ag1-like n=1 Tax=Chironomus tepperi TaxID=113505 RepID=UPI00391EF91C
MKTIIVLTFVIATIMALPIDDEKPKPEIIKQDIVHNKPDKGYHFDVETSDGSKHTEVGDFKYVGGLTVRGSYEFVDDDGKVHKVEYEADEKGFRPKIIE